MNAKNDTMGLFTKSVDSELSHEPSSLRHVVLAGLALWLGLILFLGANGAFVGRPGSPPLPIFIGFATPLAVFFTAYFAWPAFRAFILSADLRLLSTIQAWRWAGLGFLTLYAKGILPALFALPAGLGDMAIGVTAPWIVLSLIRNPAFAASRRYVIWNILGIVDFIVALTMGTLCSGAFPAITALIGNITTTAMTQLPLILIPAYMVPIFTMLHATALLQARQLARSERAKSTFNA